MDLTLKQSLALFGNEPLDPNLNSNMRIMQFGLESCHFFLQITVVQTAGGSSPIKLFLQELFVMAKKAKTGQ